MDYLSLFCNDYIFQGTLSLDKLSTTILQWLYFSRCIVICVSFIENFTTKTCLALLPFIWLAGRWFSPKKKSLFRTGIMSEYFEQEKRWPPTVPAKILLCAIMASCMVLVCSLSVQLHSSKTLGCKSPVPAKPSLRPILASSYAGYVIFCKIWGTQLQYKLKQKPSCVLAGLSKASLCCVQIWYLPSTASVISSLFSVLGMMNSTCQKIIRPKRRKLGMNYNECSTAQFQNTWMQ